MTKARLRKTNAGYIERVCRALHRLHHERMCISDLCREYGLYVTAITKTIDALHLSGIVHVEAVVRKHNTDTNAYRLGPPTAEERLARQPKRGATNRDIMLREVILSIQNESGISVSRLQEIVGAGNQCTVRNMVAALRAAKLVWYEHPSRTQSQTRDVLIHWGVDAKDKRQAPMTAVQRARRYRERRRVATIDAALTWGLASPNAAAV